MSSSEVQLRIHAPPFIEVRVLDGYLDAVDLDENLGSIRLQVPPGIYEVQFDTGETVHSEHVFAREPSRAVDVKCGGRLSFASAAPLVGSRWSPPKHLAHAVGESHSPPKCVDQGTRHDGRLFLFARDSKPSQECRSPLCGLSLLDLQGNTLLDLAEVSVRDRDSDFDTVPDPGPWAAAHLQLDSGAYRVRLKTDDGVRWEQMVYVCSNWQTQVFLTLRDRGPEAGGRLADLGRHSVLMAREGLGFVADADHALATEMANHALRTDRGRGGGSVRDKGYVRQNPMVGMFAALLELRRESPDKELLAQIVSDLVELVGEDHPDVMALQLNLILLDRLSNREAEIRRVAGGWLDKYGPPTPPMLRDNWLTLTQATRHVPDLSPPGSLSSQLQPAGYGDPWFIWESPDVLEPTTTRGGGAQVSGIERPLEEIVGLVGQVGLTRAVDAVRSFSQDDVRRRFVEQVASLQQLGADRRTAAAALSGDSLFDALGVSWNLANQTAVEALDVLRPIERKAVSDDHDRASQDVDWEKFCYQIHLLGGWNDKNRRQLEAAIGSATGKLGGRNELPVLKIVRPREGWNGRCPRIGVWFADGKPVSPIDVNLLDALMDSGNPVIVVRCVLRKYFIDPGVPDQIDRSSVTEMIGRAWTKWLFVDSVRVSKPESADVIFRMSALAGPMLSRSHIGDPGSTDRPLSVELNERYEWTSKTFFKVVTKEIGHILGLPSSHRPDQVMSAILNDVSDPQEEDIARIRGIYLPGILRGIAPVAWSPEDVADKILCFFDVSNRPRSTMVWQAPGGSIKTDTLTDRLNYCCFRVDSVLQGPPPANEDLSDVELIVLLQDREEASDTWKLGWVESLLSTANNMGIAALHLVWPAVKRPAAGTELSTLLRLAESELDEHGEVNKDGLQRMSACAEAAWMRCRTARRLKLAAELVRRSRQAKLEPLTLPDGTLRLRQRVVEGSPRDRYAPVRYRRHSDWWTWSGGQQTGEPGDGPVHQLVDTVGMNATTRDSLKTGERVVSVEELPQQLGAKASDKPMGAVFLSAGVPNDPKRGDYVRTAEPAAIRDAVHALVSVVLRGGGTLVFGGHPAVSPMVLAAARSLSSLDKVHIFQSRYFEQYWPPEALEFENLHPTERRDSIPASLEVMREEMLSFRSFTAGVFIGGMNGVEDEFKMFRKKHSDAARLPVGSTGGAALNLCVSTGVHPTGAFARLRNDLDYQGIFEDFIDK